MPPEQKSGRSAKAKAKLSKAIHARLSCGQGHSAKPFSASADDEYVHSGSSLSDAESAEEAKGDTSPGNIIYINVIYCVTRIGYSLSTATPTKEYSCWEVHPCGDHKKSSIQQLVVSALLPRSLGPISIVGVSTMPMIATITFMRSCDN
jgi:hypothetical protein